MAWKRKPGKQAKKKKIGPKKPASFVFLYCILLFFMESRKKQNHKKITINAKLPKVCTYVYFPHTNIYFNVFFKGFLSVYSVW